MNLIAIRALIKGILTSKLFWSFLLVSIMWVFHVHAINNAIKDINDKRDYAEKVAKAEAEGEARLKTDQNAASIAEAEKKSFIQGQKDAEIISNLRRDVANGSLKLRQYKDSCSVSYPKATGVATSVDSTDPTNTRRVDSDSERVIRITEIGLDALKHWEEAQSIMAADRETINKGSK